MKFFNIATAIFGLALTFSASAHISLKQSTPVQEAMLMKSPEQLSLTFSGKIRLTKVMLSNANSQTIDFGFKPSATPNTTFSWDLPILTKGNYTVKWIALGGDGHKMSGTVNFMLHADSSDSNMMQSNAESHHKHNH